MKTKEIEQSHKTIIEQLREIRDKISYDIKDMNMNQLKEYFSKQATLHSTSILKKS